MAVRYYGDLVVWQRAVDFSVEVYRQTKRFPSSELYGLTNQLRRSAVSVPSNIAEGQRRKTTADFLHFLYVARGSLNELETQIVIAQRLEYFDGATPGGLLEMTSEIGKLLGGLIASLQRKRPTGH